jgi:hypothetical protein
MDHEHVREVDPDVADALAGERDSQEQYARDDRQREPRQ